MLEVSMRKLSLLALLGLLVSLNGCSFVSDLVVVNLSDKPIEVRYRFKGPDRNSSFQPDTKPATKAYAEISRDYDWKELFTYEVHSHSRTVTVTVAPQTALLIDRISGHMPDNDEAFPISEIVMRGEYGTVMLHGEQVRKSFQHEEKQVYTLSYK